jgi:hypothetical protein
MNLSQLILATKIMIVAGLLGCGSIPVEGRYSYDRTTDFSELTSFAMADVDEGVFSTPESTAHFRRVMVRALSAKGFTENPKNPDFVVWAAPVETYIELYVLSGNVTIPTGMLRVSFLRPSGGKHYYEAAAYAYLELDWPQDEKNLVIDEAVEVIVAEFPPSK